MGMVSLREFKEHTEKILREPLPLNDVIPRVYDFLERNKGSYSIEEISQKTRLKTSEVFEAIDILREVYGLRIDEESLPVGHGAIVLYTLK